MNPRARGDGTGGRASIGFQPGRSDLAAAIVAALALAFIGVLLLTDPFWTAASGAVNFLVRKRELAPAGLALFWNPRAGLGAPLLADPRYGALYPLNFIFYLGSGRAALSVFTILHLGLFSVFTYALTRGAGWKSRTSAALALGLGILAAGVASALGFNGFVSLSWAPVLAWCLRSQRDGNKTLLVAGAGISFGLSLLAGSLTAAVVGAAVAMTVAAKLDRQAGEPTGGFASLVRPALGSLLLGLLLGAGQVLPSWFVSLPDEDEYHLLAANPRLARLFRIRPDSESLPRLFSLPDARWVASREEALKAIADPGFNGRDYVVLEGQPPEYPAPRMGNAFWPMTVLDESNNRIEALVDSKRPGYLVLLDPYEQGWRARVNGADVPLLRANGFFRAVEIGTEVSRVEFYYRPPAVVAGLALSALGSILALVLFFRRRRVLLWWALWGVILVLTPMVEGGTTYVPVAVLRVVVLAMAALWAWGLAPQGRYIRSRLDLFFLGFWLLAAAATAGSSYFFISFYWYLNITALVLLYFVSVQFAAGGENASRGLFALAVAAGAAQSAWALGEIGQSLRASAGYFNPSYLAGSLMIVSPYLLARLLRDWREHRARAYAWALLLALFTGGLVASESRAVVVWPAALLIAGWPGARELFESAGRSPRQARRMALAALAGACVILVLGLTIIPNPLRDRVRDISSDRFAFERVRIWSVAAAVVRDHPLGVGPGMFKYYSSRYRFPVEGVMAGRYEKSAENAHNEYLNLAAEMSPLAVLLAAGPAVWLIFASARAGAHRRDPLLSGAAGGMAAAALHALFDTNLHDPALATLAVMLAAVAVVQLGRTQPRWTRNQELRPAGVRLVQLGLLLLFAGGTLGNFIFARSYRQTLMGMTEPDIARASVRLTEATGNSMGNEQPWRHLASLYLSSYRQDGEVTRLEQAEKAAATARKLNPVNAENYRLLGEIYLEIFLYFRTEKAGEMTGKMFGEALRLDPNNVETIKGMARSRQAIGDPQGEARWLETALALEPHDLNARARLVRSLARSGRLVLARKQLTELIARWREVERARALSPIAFHSAYRARLVEFDPREIEELEKMLSVLEKGSGPQR